MMTLIHQVYLFYSMCDCLWYVGLLSTNLKTLGTVQIPLMLLPSHRPVITSREWQGRKKP